MFRTSIATQLTSNGENMKTAQQTLGHANPHITADVYAQAVPSEVRSAHDKLVDMVIAAKKPAKSDVALVGPMWPQISEDVSVSC